MSEDEVKNGQSFTMPEGDGIQNGVPLDEAANLDSQPELTPSGFNERMRNSTKSATGNTEPEDGVNLSDAAGIMASSGFTIKAKLMASLSLLTLIILTLGIISFSSIVEINDLSIGIAERQSALAKTTEEIKASVFLARDAEKDFLIKEEQEALNRSSRFIAKLRTQIEKAIGIGTEIAKTTGVTINSQYEQMADLVDSYEAQFSEQVKNVKEARAALDQDILDTQKVKVDLADQADRLRAFVKGIVDDFWILTKNNVAEATVNAEKIADEAAADARAAKVTADKKLADDNRIAANLLIKDQEIAKQKLVDAITIANQKLKDNALKAEQLIAKDKVIADAKLDDLAANALKKFNRDADTAIQEAARLDTNQGVDAVGGATGNDLDNNAAAAAAAAAAVKTIAIESQELLAKQTAAAAKEAAEASEVSTKLAAEQAVDAAELLAENSITALKLSAEKAKVAADKVAAAAVVAANLVFDNANEAAEKAFAKTEAENIKVRDAVNLGTTLADLDRELLAMQINVARYLQLNKQSFADEAIASIDTALAIVDQVRRSSKDAKLNLQMVEARKQLLGYQKQFRSAVADADQMEENEAAINAAIDQQKASLKQTGEKVIALAGALSSDSWNSIATQSNQLQVVGSDAQSLLMILVVVGVLIGGFVLYAVPKPILAAINQLLLGAQRVAAGDLTQQIKVESRDELGQLASTFDHMRANLMNLVDRIQRASVQISTTVNEIQAASSQQSATSTEQAGALNEFSVTLREIAQSAEKLAGNAGVVADSSGSVAEKVGDANSRSGQMMESMNAIGDSTRQTSDRIKALNDQMDTITDAVSSISGVADQTTLLSLNAAIEANKAGEMGKGFSVVATEIRRLSDRSIDSAGGISGMVRDIQRATESSVVSMDKSSEEIRVGIDLVQDSTSTMQEVNLSMSEITTRTQEIAKGVGQQATSSTEAQQTITELLSASNTAAQAARQTSSAAYELNAMATQLSDAVSAFKT